MGDRILTVGIGVDNWKLPVFRKHLTEAGFAYEDGGPITGDATLLKVKTNEVIRLGRLVEKCQFECRKGKKQ